MSYPRLDEHAETITRRLSQEIAREFGLDYVGTEHILLAILRYGRGIGAEVLHDFGVREDTCRQRIEQTYQKDKEDTWVFGRLPGTPHYRNVIASAIEEARQTGSDEIRSEHLLLGLLHERGSVAQRVLAGFGIELDDCRQKVLAKMRG